VFTTILYATCIIFLQQEIPRTWFGLSQTEIKINVLFGVVSFLFILLLLVFRIFYPGRSNLILFVASGAFFCNVLAIWMPALIIFEGVGFERDGAAFAILVSSASILLTELYTRAMIDGLNAPMA
jgi:hypothetical protein